jgi:hypothetical protein
MKAERCQRGIGNDATFQNTLYSRRYGAKSQWLVAVRNSILPRDVCKFATSLSKKIGLHLMQKVEFWVYVLDHVYPMRATNWSEVRSELYSNGYVNMGEVKVIKRTYDLISEEPQIINTDY